MKRLLLIAALLMGLSAASPAQCVMCYRSAHAQNQARSRVLNLGILILGAPPFLILAGFVAFVFKRNERYRYEESSDNVSASTSTPAAMDSGDEYSSGR